jgi:tetratricopeptide (TPR) repeat protein
MKKKFSIIASTLALLLITSAAISQKKTMTWTTKSDKAKELASKGVNHMMNIELPQAYEYFKQALDLDPDFTVALVFMANLTNGATKKAWSAKAVKSSANKTEGEKLFASLQDMGATQESRRETWTKLHNMFPDGKMISLYYLFTRATPAEQFTIGQEMLKKFPDEACFYNIMAYLYLQEKKDTATAKTYFEKYIAMYPAGSNPYDSMGEFYFMTGDMANSEKYYNMALEIYPFSSSSVDKLKEIKVVKEKDEAKASAN